MANGKLIGLAAGAVVVIGLLVGVQSLTRDEPAPVDEDTRTTSVIEEDEDTAGTSRRGPGTRTKVGTIGSGSSAQSARPNTRTSGPRPTGEAELSDAAPVDTTTAVAAVATPAGPAEELTDEQKENRRKVADLVALFRNQTDPDERIDLADELGMIDDPESIRKLLELAQTETDPEVQEALLNALTGLDALEELAAEAIPVLERLAKGASEQDVRIAAQDSLGEIANAGSVQALRTIYNDSSIDPSERLNAAENLMRLRSNQDGLVTDAEARAINEQLKLDFQAGSEPAFRSQAAMALAQMGKENLPFFQEMLQREQDPNVKNLLEKLTRMNLGQ